MSCWICTDIKLVQIEGNKWKCSKCKDIYYKCDRCEQKGEDNFDADDNDKGINCVKCDKHFCILCWQTTGNLIDSLIENDKYEYLTEKPYNYDIDNYLCENCLKIYEPKE